MILKLFEIFRAGIKFCPDGNHNVRMETVMERPDHTSGIGIAGRIEFMISPAILFPVKPVLNDVVERDAAIAKFFDDGKYFILCIVMLPRLP